MIIGVLALQGSFAEHIKVLEELKVNVKEIRLEEDLNNIDGLIIPGGESTCIGKLLKDYKLDKKILEQHKNGMGIYGTCAGAIILGKGHHSLGLIDIKYKRNAYGRQLDSFNTMIKLETIGDIEGVFIRAPKTDHVGKDVKVLGMFENSVIAAEQNKVLVTTFHPELTTSTKVHEYFIKMLK
jgi:pyridoxal 5'-phosphate synthase pdxT subunit